MLVNYLKGDYINYDELYRANPQSDYIYYSYRAYVPGGEKLYYSYSKEQLQKEIPQCCDVKIYYFNGENIPLGEKVHTRIFCKVKKNENIKYEDMFASIGKVVVIKNKCGENVVDYHKPFTKSDSSCYPLKGVLYE